MNLVNSLPDTLASKSTTYGSKDKSMEKLIDEIGYLDDAIEVVKKKADIADAKVIMYHRPYSYKNNIYSRMMTSDLTTINLLNIDVQWLMDDTGLRFMYLWFP